MSICLIKEVENFDRAQPNVGAVAPSSLQPCVSRSRRAGSASGRPDFGNRPTVSSDHHFFAFKGAIN
jgi:hypothetical protein